MCIPKRWGICGFAMVLVAGIGVLGQSQDAIPRAPNLDNDLIREMDVGNVPQNAGYSTDLWHPNPYFSDRDPRAYRAPPPGVVGDILRLRASHQNTPVDPVEEAEFAVALRKLVAQKQRRHAALSRLAIRLPADIEPIAAPSERQQQLRQSALQLDATAARLEIAGDYEAADQSRANAQRLWQEARLTIE